MARTSAIKRNELVKKNRAIAERLIQSVCFLGKQELAFRGHDEKETSDNRGNYLELLDFLALNESLIKEHLQSDVLFKGTSAMIQNEFIECITEVIYESIDEEMQKAMFISMQADETTDVSVKGQLSIILRYVHSETGEIQERFMGFYNVSADKTTRGQWRIQTSFSGWGGGVVSNVFKNLKKPTHFIRRFSNLQSVGTE